MTMVALENGNAHSWINPFLLLAKDFSRLTIGQRREIENWRAVALLVDPRYADWRVGLNQITKWVSPSLFAFKPACSVHLGKLGFQPVSWRLCETGHHCPKLLTTFAQEYQLVLHPLRYTWETKTDIFGQRYLHRTQNIFDYYNLASNGREWRYYTHGGKSAAQPTITTPFYTKFNRKRK